MKLTDPGRIKEIILSCEAPVVLKDVCKWEALGWSLDSWKEALGPEEMPFRCKPTSSSSRPDWESRCPTVNMTFDDFISAASDPEADSWFYFDYKRMHEWFKPSDPLYKQVSWESFGFPGKDATDSTIWIGSKGAHTPCHIDTYGRNVVVQMFGRKQWILFPPDTPQLKPSRVPYEESSIYSQLNFSSPSKLDAFNGIKGCRMVTLEPGDALVVPPKWWHYVQNDSNIAISINYWIPCDRPDAEARVEEALTRLFVAQICKDLPEEKSKSILNPNEEYLSEMPLTVAILQVESAVTEFLKLRKNDRKHKLSINMGDAKRIKLDDTSSSVDTEVEETSSDYTNVHQVEEIDGDKLMRFLKRNMDRNANEKEDDTEDNITNLTTCIINSFCESSVMKSIKENLISNLK